MHNSVTIRLLAEYLIPDTMVVLKSRRCIAMLMADAAVLLRGEMINFAMQVVSCILN